MVSMKLVTVLELAYSLYMSQSSMQLNTSKIPLPNPRVSTIILKIDNVGIVLNAPTGEKDEEVEEYFFATLANVFDSSNGNFRIVLGDLYAKLG